MRIFSNFKVMSGLITLLAVTSAINVSAHESTSESNPDMWHKPVVDEMHLHVGWESLYMLEGRDMLNGDSLATASFELGLGSLVGAVWYGKSPDQQYDELRLSLAMAKEVGDFSYYFSYTYLNWMADGDEDNELGTGVSWAGFPLDMEVALDIYYSVKADGTFGELSLSREFEVCDSWTLTASVALGVNQGYIADGHDGLNHVACVLESRHKLSECLALTIHTGYSWGLEQDASLPGDDLLGDSFHGGVSLQWEF